MKWKLCLLDKILSELGLRTEPAQQKQAYLDERMKEKGYTTKR
jgi:hypothetical protein